MSTVDPLHIHTLVHTMAGAIIGIFTESLILRSLQTQMGSDMTFWSLSVPGGGEQPLEIEQSPTTAQYVHVTNVALGMNPSDGTNTLSIIQNGVSLVLCHLSKANTMQYPLQLMLDESVTFKNSGKTTIHLTGFVTSSSDVDDDEGLMDEDEDEVQM